jgi:hypothetical protein
MTEVERPRRLARWISWLVVVLLVVAIAAVFLSSAREWVLIAAMLGLVAAWLISALVRLGRRRPVAAVVTVLVVAVAGVFAAGTLFYWSFGRQAPNDQGVLPTGPVTVRYFGSGQLDGTNIVLTETIVIDDETGAAILRIFGPMSPSEDTDQMQDPEGWGRATPVDGFATYVRTRTIRPSDANLISSTLAVPLDLGRLRVRGGSVALSIRDGSRVVLATPKGAVGATFPGSTAIDPRHDGGEVTTIPVDRDVADITLTVLAPSLRNPAGHQFYDAVTWGPLPWLIGALVGLVGSTFWDRILRLLGVAGRRVVRPGRTAPAIGSAGD